LLRLGPYKLAYVLNKCLDRFERPDENVQPASNLPNVSTPNLPQPLSAEPLTVISPPHTLSPPPVEMPPLLNQPHWHHTDKPDGHVDSSSLPESSEEATPIAGTPAVQGRMVSILPKLTIPSRSFSEGYRVLITDDNAINRRVSFCY
jgi:hypothetical protein